MASAIRDGATDEAPGGIRRHRAARCHRADHRDDRHDTGCAPTVVGRRPGQYESVAAGGAGAGSTIAPSAQCSRGRLAAGRRGATREEALETAESLATGARALAGGRRHRRLRRWSAIICPARQPRQRGGRRCRSHSVCARISMRRSQVCRFAPTPSSRSCRTSSKRGRPSR